MCFVSVLWLGDPSRFARPQTSRSRSELRIAPARFEHELLFDWKRSLSWIHYLAKTTRLLGEL